MDASKFEHMATEQQQQPKDSNRRSMPESEDSDFCEVGSHFYSPREWTLISMTQLVDHSDHSDHSGGGVIDPPL